MKLTAQLANILMEASSSITVLEGLLTVERLANLASFLKFVYQLTNVAYITVRYWYALVWIHVVEFLCHFPVAVSPRKHNNLNPFLSS